MSKDVLRLLGHPLHATIVHFPLGLLGSAPLWDGLGLAGIAGPWWTIGYWVVAVGLVLAVLAAVAGLVDFLRAVEGPARATGTWHLFANVAALAAFAIGWLLRDGPVPAEERRVAILALDAVGLLLLGIGGWLGGELVFRHGVGRRTERPAP